MRLYEALVGVSNNIKGRIWCTDGSFISPGRFKESGRTAYGYTLNNTTAVSLTRSTRMAWSPKDSPFYNDMTKAGSLADGVANSNCLKSIEGFSPSNCPAIYYACTQVNGGKTSYMPAVDEISNLYSSIMYGYGDMRTDLITAGLLESCNYSNPSHNSNSVTSGEWYWIWSSTQYSDESTTAWYVNCYGGWNCYYKDSDYCVIPFFKIE